MCLKGNSIFQVIAESVCELVVKQLKQHQNTMEDKFIVCLNKIVKGFPPLADRYGTMAGGMGLGWQVRECVSGHLLMNLSLPTKVLECFVLSAAKISWSNEDALSGSGTLSSRGDHRPILTVKE